MKPRPQDGALKRQAIRAAGWRIERGDPLCHCTRCDYANALFEYRGGYYYQVDDVCLNCKRKVQR